MKKQKFSALSLMVLLSLSAFSVGSLLVESAPNAFAVGDGVGLTKTCVSPIFVGAPFDCSGSITSLDTAPNSHLVTGAIDCIGTGVPIGPPGPTCPGTDLTDPVSITSVSGNAACMLSGSTLILNCIVAKAGVAFTIPAGFSAISVVNRAIDGAINIESTKTIASTTAGAQIDFVAVVQSDQCEGIASDLSCSTSPLLTVQLGTTMVNKVTTTTTTILIPPTVTIGNSFVDSATLTGATADASGPYHYQFFNSAACTGTAASIDTQTVAGGFVPNSNPVTLTATGPLSVNGVYDGDAKNVGSTSACELITVVIPPTTTTTTLIPPTVIIGNSFVDSATLTGTNIATAGGTVNYQFFNSATCTGTPSINTQPVTLGVVPNSASVVLTATGPNSVNAVYSGDASHGTSTSACEPLTVVIPPTVTTTTLKPSTVLIGGSFVDSATLTGANIATAGGTVNYQFFNVLACAGTPSSINTQPVAGGVVPDSASVTFTATGPNSVNAVYSGDASHAGSTSACELLIVQPSTPVGGVIVPIDTTALLVAGVLTNWTSVLSTLGVIGAAGIAITIFRKQNKK